MFCGSNKYSLRYNKTDTKIKGKMKKKVSRVTIMFKI